MDNKSNDTYSLSHTSWKCQYHIVFAPKYRRKAIYGKLKRDIGAILRELCERKHVSIIEANAMPDHIHMLVEIPPNQRVSDFMGYLKGKSTMIIFERYSNLKYKYGNRHFWCRGYYVSTVGGNKKNGQLRLPALFCLLLMMLIKMDKTPCHNIHCCVQVRLCTPSSQALHKGSLFWKTDPCQAPVCHP